MPTYWNLTLRLEKPWKLLRPKQENGIFLHSLLPREPNAWNHVSMGPRVAIQDAVAEL